MSLAMLSIIRISRSHPQTSFFFFFFFLSPTLNLLVILFSPLFIILRKGLLLSPDYSYSLIDTASGCATNVSGNVHGPLSHLLNHFLLVDEDVVQHTCN